MLDYSCTTWYRGSEKVSVSGIGKKIGIGLTLLVVLINLPAHKTSFYPIPCVNSERASTFTDVVLRLS